MSAALPILYQDQYIIAVHKPAGLLVHRSAVDRHETRFAMQLVRNQIGQHVYPVHRLDKPTSGILLFALDADTARLLTERFSHKEMQKSYLAVVRGFTAATGHIDYPLLEEPDRMTDRKAQTGKPAQAAITDYRCLDQVELPFPVGRYASCRYSLLEVTPHTGRKHQIRRHMKHIFHPVIGDTTHGDGRHNQFFRDQFDCRRLLLCATSMELTHPHTQATIRLTTTLDADFQSLLHEFGWSRHSP